MAPKAISSPISPQEFSRLLDDLVQSSQAELAAARSRLQSLRDDAVPG